MGRSAHWRRQFLDPGSPTGRREGGIGSRPGDGESTHAQGLERNHRAWLYRGLAVLASPGFVRPRRDQLPAAFVDTTDNATNTFSAGDVVLDDDDAGSVLFNVANMAPGDSRTRCIAVSYTGFADLRRPPLRDGRR